MTRQGRRSLGKASEGVESTTVSHDDEDEKAMRERWWQDVCERYGPFVISNAMNALNHGDGEREFGRVMDLREYGDDRDEFERCVAAWLEPFRNEEIGRKQRDSGKMSPGRRGQHLISPEKLVADVRAMHARSPLLTFNDVCRKVATANGYKSAYPAKLAAAAIKWPDPRRKQK